MEINYDLPYQISFSLQGMDFISIDRMNAFYWPKIKGFVIDEYDDTNCLYGYSRYTDTTYLMKRINKQADFIRHSLPVDSFFSGAIYPGTKQEIVLAPYIKEVVDFEIKDSQVTIAPLRGFSELSRDSGDPIQITIYGLDIRGHEVKESINIVANVNYPTNTEWKRITGILALYCNMSVTISFMPYIAGDVVLSKELIIDRQQLEANICVLTVDKFKKNLVYNMLRENSAEYPMGFDILKTIPLRLLANHEILAHYIDEPNSLLYVAHGKKTIIPAVPGVPGTEAAWTDLLIHGIGSSPFQNPRPSWGWSTLPNAQGTGEYYHAPQINSDMHYISLYAMGDGPGIPVQRYLRINAPYNHPDIPGWPLPSVYIWFTDDNSDSWYDYESNTVIDLQAYLGKSIGQIEVNWEDYYNGEYFSGGLDVLSIELTDSLASGPGTPGSPEQIKYLEHTFSCYPLIIPTTPDNTLDTNKTQYQAVSIEYEEDCINEEWNMWLFPTSKTNDVETCNITINGVPYIEGMLLDLIRYDISTNRITLPFSEIYTDTISSAKVEIETYGRERGYVVFTLDRTVLEPLYNKNLDSYLKKFKKGPADIENYSLPTVSSTKTSYKGGDLIGWGDGKYGGITETLPEKPVGYGGLTDINYLDFYEIYKLSSTANVAVNGQKIINIFNAFYADQNNKFIVTSDTITHIKGSSCNPDFKVIAQSPTDILGASGAVGVTFNAPANASTLIAGNINILGPAPWRYPGTFPLG
jgi:hypothetical protein